MAKLDGSGSVEGGYCSSWHLSAFKSGRPPRCMLPQSRCSPLRCAGTIPLSWGLPGTFPALQAFEVLSTQLTGTLPAFWGTNGSFPALLYLHMDSCPVSGTLPADWGSPRAFPQLAGLPLTNCRLSGQFTALATGCCKATRPASCCALPTCAFMTAWWSLLSGVALQMSLWPDLFAEHCGLHTRSCTH